MPDSDEEHHHVPASGDSQTSLSTWLTVASAARDKRTPFVSSTSSVFHKPPSAETTEPPTKRPRGRPPGSKATLRQQKESMVSVDIANSISEQQQESSAPSQNQRKRGKPGRPRNPVKTQPQKTPRSQQSGVDTTESETNAGLEPGPDSELKAKKAGKSGLDEDTGSKPKRTILSFFDRSATVASKESREDEKERHTNSTVKTPSYKQSCLSFDRIDPLKAGSLISGETRSDEFSKSLPKLEGRAPYEDLVNGMLARSLKLPSMSKLDLHHPELDMDMLADVKMVHEFLNTFGLPLGLTKDSGEWISFDMLLAMIRNPRIDTRLLDLLCKMVLSAYNGEHAPEISQFNFSYYLAVGPSAHAARSTIEEKKVDKKGRHTSSKKCVHLGNLGSKDYSFFTVSDRIEALVKALHDITSSEQFHTFMRDEVEDSLEGHKRLRRKRKNDQKGLETQVMDLERQMEAIERDVANLENQRQEILAEEQEPQETEEDLQSTRMTASSRQLRLAHTKGIRSRANDLLNQQRALTNDLRATELTWQDKVNKLKSLSNNDNEIQKNRNVPLTQLRGGQAVDTDRTLRVVSLGSDRWGRKYWFWREFGGVIVEDRGQVEPRPDQDRPNEEEDMDVEDSEPKKENFNSTEDATITDVTRRMKSMLVPGSKMTNQSGTMDDAASAETSHEAGLSPETETSKADPSKDDLDYGPVQPWSIITNSKELSALMRALNTKGTRERILKASIITMFGEIQESFNKVRDWAGMDFAADNKPVIAVHGAVGQPLSMDELNFLKKKRGRKSNQELADIAATKRILDAAAENEMDVDRADTSFHGRAMDMEVDEDCTDGEDGNDSKPIAATAGFLADVEPDLGSGLSSSEYHANATHSADEKLQRLSGEICGGDRGAITKAVEDLLVNEQQDYVQATVEVLRYCLDVMDVPDAVFEMNITNEGTESNEMKQDPVHDAADETPISEPAILENQRRRGIVLSTPVSVDAHFSSWIREFHMDRMLDSVKTFGGLNAWLDEFLRSVADMVDYSKGNNGSQQKLAGLRKRQQKEEDLEEHDQDDDEEEDERDDEHEHDDDEAEDTGYDKAQEDDRDDEDEADEEEERYPGQRKAPQELKSSFVGGRALRARGGNPISYSDNLDGFDEEYMEEGEESEGDDHRARRSEEEDEDGDDNDDDDENISSRLRRSKRSRH